MTVVFSIETLSRQCELHKDANDAIHARYDTIFGGDREGENMQAMKPHCIEEEG